MGSWRNVRKCVLSHNLHCFVAANKNRCPICYKHLKSWPARLGGEFVCMSPHRCTGPNADGSGKRATRNLTGDDRLTCYKCDFDMCRSVSGHGFVH